MTLRVAVRKHFVERPKDREQRGDICNLANGHEDELGRASYTWVSLEDGGEANDINAVNSLVDLAHLYTKAEVDPHECPVVLHRLEKSHSCE